ncbi:predicted protein, partial [Haematococcus lacustris]
MVQQPEELERLSAKTDHTNLQALVCGVSDVSFKHLYTDELLTVDAEVKIGGISETALWVITELPGKEPMNVVAFQDSSFEQVLDERRLRLLLDSKGRVLAAGDSSISLFNLDPQALVGLPLTHILDVLRPKACDDDPLNDASAAAALMDMANRSFSTPGLSWRVGVAPIMDPDKLAALGPIGMAMIARRTVPAIMTVEPHLDGGHMEGASVRLPAEMHLMVELWRADLLSGILELDTQGNVVQLGVKEQPIYSPHLLLGYPASMLQGAAISALLPTVGKAHLEA